MVIVIVLIAVAVLLLGSATFVAVGRRRDRGPMLEPPPVPPIERPPRRPSGRATPPATRPPTRPGDRAPTRPADRAPTRPADRASAPPTERAPAPATGAPAPPGVRPPAPPADQAGPAAPAPPELTPDQLAELEEALTEVEAPPEPAPPAPPPSARPRIRDRLGKARSLLAGYMSSVRSRGRIDAETWEELEEALIRADVGIDTTTALLDALRVRVKREGVTDPEELLVLLKADVVAQLQNDREMHFEPGGPNVWLFVGVNGVGKTTTIGKVGLREAAAGRSVVMAAGDTFRAAAADQLALWAERVGADLVRGSEGGDPGAVVFDAVERASARQADLVLADTAGRLHTKVNLMEELKKVGRVAARPPGRLTEVLLVIDATTGQNGLVQAKEFASAVGVTGVVLTKLDGTAKGGIALAIEAELKLPVKLVGLGESAEDLVEFDPEEFVDAIFS